MNRKKMKMFPGIFILTSICCAINTTVGTLTDDSFKCLSSNLWSEKWEDRIMLSIKFSKRLRMHISKQSSSLGTKLDVDLRSLFH